MRCLWWTKWHCNRSYRRMGINCICIVHNICTFVFQLLEQFRSENQRLKDENGALIRVISKLSKWCSRTPWLANMFVYSTVIYYNYYYYYLSVRQWFVSMSQQYCYSHFHNIGVILSLCKNFQMVSHVHDSSSMSSRTWQCAYVVQIMEGRKCAYVLVIVSNMYWWQGSVIWSNLCK